MAKKHYKRHWQQQELRTYHFLLGRGEWHGNKNYENKMHESKLANKVSTFIYTILRAMGDMTWTIWTREKRQQHPTMRWFFFKKKIDLRCLIAQSWMFGPACLELLKSVSTMLTHSYLFSCKMWTLLYQIAILWLWQLLY